MQKLYDPQQMLEMKSLTGNYNDYTAARESFYSMALHWKDVHTYTYLRNMRNSTPSTIINQITSSITCWQIQSLSLSSGY